MNVLFQNRRRVLQGLAALVASGWMPALHAQAPLTSPRFAALTSALTGFTYTDASLATALLRALSDAVGAETLDRIATLAAVIAPAQLGDELRIAGLERQAVAVTVALYSGVVTTSKGPVVLTYDDALAWKAVPWTKPNAQCGGMTDYWAAAPAGEKP